MIIYLQILHAFERTYEIDHVSADVTNWNSIDREAYCINFPNERTQVPGKKDPTMTTLSDFGLKVDTQIQLNEYHFVFYFIYKHT